MGSPATRRQVPAAFLVITIIVGLAVLAVPTPASATPPAGIISTVYRSVPAGPLITRSAVTPSGDIYLRTASGPSDPKVARVNGDGSLTPIHSGINCPQDPTTQPPGLFCGVQDLAAGPDGNLYAVSQESGYLGTIVSETYLWRLTPSGVLTMLAGGGIGDPADGGLASDTVMWPSAGVTVDVDGNILYTDSRGLHVRGGR